MKFKLWRHPFRMFRILRFVWKARKPSTVHDMPAVVDTFWLKSGYEALTFFGTILTHSQQDADHMNRRFDELKNHEMIHLKQAITTGDSWWRFYRLYLKFWLQGWRARKRHKNAGYWLNPFEMEAYEHMHDLSYIEQCKNGATGWRRFAAMTMEERRDYRTNRTNRTNRTDRTDRTNRTNRTDRTNRTNKQA